MKKYITPLNIVFALEILVVILSIFGIAPREAILVWTGLAVFYMIFSPVEDALWLVVASIPLYAALPISENFDTLANWRILILVLFLCVFFKKGISIGLFKNAAGQWRIKENIKHYVVEYLSVIFLLISAFSIFIAGHKILAIKKLLFLVNIFLLFLVIRNLTRTKEAVLKIWQAAAIGGAAALIIALVQFFSVWFAPLINFWLWWDFYPINFFYGQGLANLLSYSNTWFAYYGAAPPTLRLFSVFPDSHSLAMFLILLIPIILAWVVFYEQQRNRKIFLWTLIGLALFCIVFSGSRGAWLSIAPIIVLAFYFSWRRAAPALIKKIMLGIFIFLLFFISFNGYPPLFYKIQSWQSGQKTDADFSFFERARSISDADELSNKGRLEIWQRSLKSIAAQPLLGVGLGNYVTVLDESAANAKKGASAHNLYLDFAAEIGVVGMLILLAMFANILYTSWLVWRRATEPHFNAFGLFFGLYFLWVMTYSLFDVVLLNDKVFLLFMVGAATLFSLRAMLSFPPAGGNSFGSSNK